MKILIRISVLMCFITTFTYGQKIKVTGGVNFMDINYAVSNPNTEPPMDNTPLPDTDITTKISVSKASTSLNRASLSSFSYSESSNKTGFYIGLALADINLSNKFELQPEIRFVGVKGFNQIQVPVLVSYHISEQFKAQAGPSLGFLLDTGERVKTTNFAIDFGLSYNISETIAVGARYDWGQTNLLKGGNSDNYLKINNIQVGVSYQFGNEKGHSK
ncbi:outer membrane beta-barrel protein [uncultured Algibacter sp.]|uniref:outer membrane beta-barrel protein n=1 Tax=uncultured Algibacter sp. TaxID=298659 RepID=UPI002639484F|nr:outer membrane beta-barrel protein [uncultured Algibacter sp.]